MSETSCQLPECTAAEEEISAILNESKVIAVVGLSPNSEKDSYRVGRYLQEQGYRIVPVNPAYPEILGERSYASLMDIPFEVDVVDIFRKEEAIPEVVEEAIKKKVKTVWMQLGLSHDQAAARALTSGLKVVQNRCMKIEHGKRKSTPS
jgi:predicted CoA-binding protein